MWYFSASTVGAWAPETVSMVRICMYYRYFSKKLNLHQSKNLVNGRIFFKKKNIDLKPRAYLIWKKVYGSFLDSLHMISTWFLRPSRRHGLHESIFSIDFFLKPRFFFILKTFLIKLGRDEVFKAKAQLCRGSSKKLVQAGYFKFKKRSATKS